MSLYLTLQSIQQYLSLLKVIAHDKPIASAHLAHFLNKYHTTKFCLEAERRGYKVLLSDRAATDDQRFVVMFTAVGLLTPQCFLDQALEAKKLIEEYGGKYGGYEHSATKADPADPYDEDFIPVDYQAEPHCGAARMIICDADASNPQCVISWAISELPGKAILTLTFHDSNRYFVCCESRAEAAALRHKAYAKMRETVAANV